MKDEDIINVLKQDYQHTIILYSFEDKIFFAEQNLRSSLNSCGAMNKSTMATNCIINQGNLRYCSWDKSEKNRKNGKEYVLEGDIVINNFMAEIHKIYKKAESDINSNDTLILQAFSLALKSAVAQGIIEDHDKNLCLSIKRNAHYIFILPTEWEHSIKEKIILPIFKQAGLVHEEEQPCKLLFYTELDVMLQVLQQKKLEFERGREYILWKLDPINRNTLTMTYDCFEASDSKTNNRSREESKQFRAPITRNPVSVYSSNKVYSLTYTDTIRESVVRKFLKGKGIIAVLPGDPEERKVMVVIDLLIETALECYSRKLENKDDLSKLSKVYPFKYLDLSVYSSILSSEKLLKSIDMFEIHEVIFRDNEAVIEEAINDMVTNSNISRSVNKRRTIFLAHNNLREDFTAITQRIEANKFPRNSYLSRLYIKWIYHCFILKLFRNDDDYYQTLFASTKLQYSTIYDTSSMITYAALKFKKNASFLITRLPPLLLSLPCSHKQYVGLQDLQFTKRSNPDYIVKIDVKLYDPSTFSCIQLDSHGKNSSVNAILTTEHSKDNNYMSLPALSNYFKPNSTNGVCYPERIYITTRLLEIISTHFKYALDHFSKYDRQKSMNEKSFTVEDKTLDFKDESSLIEDESCLLSRSFDDMIPKIKLELEKSDGKEEISQQCYIRVFLMIYLGVLKYNISTFLEKKKIGKKGGAADENTIIGYTILVDAFFFHAYLKESQSSLIELAIASGFAKDEEDCKSNVRVITDREEQLLPMLEQKLGTSLPLKSFYVHVRLYERYLHITLNQVVIEGLLPEQNSKNIVIKSKVIATSYLLDTICDNLWDAAQNYNCIVPDANCKHHFEDYATSPQEFLLTELEGCKAKFLHIAKKLFSTDSISEVVDKSITTTNDCGCKLYFGSEDIFDLGILPAIKYTVSVFTGAITNEDIFGLYGIEHFFVAFNYFSNVFHRSYQKYFEYNLKKLIDINLEKKRLKIPYTVFPEPVGGLLQPMISESCILADSFLYGNILQVFGETYSFKTQKNKMYSKEVFGAGKYRVFEEKGAMTIVKKGEIIPRTGVIEKVFYIRSDLFDDSYATAVITKRGSSDYNINNSAKQSSESLLEEYIVDNWNIFFLKKNKKLPSDIPLYVTVKYLNYSSSVILSIYLGYGLIQCDDKDIANSRDTHYSRLTERLTIINTQLK